MSERLELRCPSCSYSYDKYEPPQEEPARGNWIGYQLEILEKEHPYHPSDD
jgi:hypothetical protein